MASRRLACFAIPSLAHYVALVLVRTASLVVALESRRVDPYEIWLCGVLIPPAFAHTGEQSLTSLREQQDHFWRLPLGICFERFF